MAATGRSEYVLDIMQVSVQIFASFLFHFIVALNLCYFTCAEGCWEKKTSNGYRLRHRYGFVVKNNLQKISAAAALH